MAAYTEVTNENVFQRLGQSIKNVLVGLILLPFRFRCCGGTKDVR